MLVGSSCSCCRLQCIQLTKISTMSDLAMVNVEALASGKTREQFKI